MAGVTVWVNLSFYVVVVVVVVVVVWIIYVGKMTRKSPISSGR